jgi:hypothetical protein
MNYPVSGRMRPTAMAALVVTGVLVVAVVFALRVLVGPARSERESHAYRKLSVATKLRDMVQQRATAEEVTLLLGREFPISLSQAEEFLRERSMKTQTSTSGSQPTARMGASYFNTGEGDFFVVVFWDSGRHLLDFAIDSQ